MSNIIDKIKLSGVTYTLSAQTAGGSPTVELTQAEYDALVSAGTVSADTYYIITDAQAGDLTQYWTSAQTQSAINQATSGKVNTSSVVSSVTSASTDSEIPTAKAVFDAIPTGGTGGGKAIEAGRGISVTTGETADTVSFSLPISAGTGNGSLIIGDNGGGTSTASVASGVGAVAFAGRRFYGKNYATEESSFAHGSGCSAGTCSHAEGFYTKCMSGFNSHSEGDSTEARGNSSHAEGDHTLAGEDFYKYSCHAEGCHTSAMTSYSHTEGYYTKATNESEHSQGRYNVSNKANNTWGDSGNTLFSVGNGTADNARHNALEIRQNGDIYITSGGTDILLQDNLGGGGGGITSGEVQTMIDESISGKADSSDVYLKSETSGATEISTALGGKQDTLSAGTNITISGNVISAQLEGGAVSRGDVEDMISAATSGLVSTSAITSAVTSASTDSEIPTAKAVYDATQSGGGGGMTEDDELLLSTALVDLNERKIDASEVKSNYQRKGDYVTTSTLNTRLAEYETALDEQNVEEVTAYALNDLNERFGGLKITKITESEYAALTTKDENTLYIVVADPS